MLFNIILLSIFLNLISGIWIRVSYFSWVC